MTKDNDDLIADVLASAPELCAALKEAPPLDSNDMYRICADWKRQRVLAQFHRERNPFTGKTLALYRWLSPTAQHH